MLKLFQSTIYIRIYKDRFILYHLESGKTIEVSSPIPFSTGRLLIGNFTEALKFLKSSLKQLPLSYSPSILIHPQELIEGGISEVEERIFSELAIQAGAKVVKIHTGQTLSNDEIRKIL